MIYCVTGRMVMKRGKEKSLIKWCKSCNLSQPKQGCFLNWAMFTLNTAYCAVLFQYILCVVSSYFKDKIRFTIQIKISLPAVNFLSIAKSHNGRLWSLWCCMTMHTDKYLSGCPRQPEPPQKLEPPLKIRRTHIISSPGILWLWNFFKWT